MAVAWKKVYVEGDDIPVADGGTGQGGFTDGAVILGNGTGGALQEVVMADNEILVGVTDGDPTSEAVAGNLAMDTPGVFSIKSLQVTGGSASGMIQADTTLWTYNESSISGSDLKPLLPFYKPNAATAATLNVADTVAAPVSTGDTLQYNATSNTLLWGASTASSLGIDDQAAVDDEYHIAFVDLSAGTDVFNVDSTALTYNPSTNLLTNGFVTLDGDTAYAAGTNGVVGFGSVAATAGGVITASQFVGLASEASAVAIHSVASAANAHAIPFYFGEGVGFKSLMSESTFHYTPNDDLLTVGDITTTDLTVTNTIDGDINGTAAIATTVTVTNEGATDAGAQAIRYLTFVDGDNGAQSLETDSADLIYYPEAVGEDAGGTLKVPNLIVTGTTTTVDTTNLTVKDETIKVGTGNTTSGQAVGAGILANISTASDLNLPGITYAGIGNAPGGWYISRAANDAASSSSITTGISTMEIDDTMIASNYDDGNSGAISFGVGSFLWSGAVTGGLFIQTSV